MTAITAAKQNGNRALASFTIIKPLGYGGCARVYRAASTMEGDGHVVALKKSRVSLRVKRPMLQHEARLLRLLCGHPTIPKLYAYGRFEHFEYLALELLGPSLRDLHKERHRFPLRAVLLVADQMLSALVHIHAHGIVHRDIKPDNILLHRDSPEQADQLCLIDFGIARHFRSGDPIRHDPLVERVHVVGTLNWASLNAHYGIDLSRRDDMESLAYTLLFLRRGDLPWRKHTSGRGTMFGKMAQVREKKLAWTGSRLGFGHPAEFGKLLDDARQLGFDEVPDYTDWRAQFRSLHERFGYTNGPLDWTVLEHDNLSPYPEPIEPIQQCVVGPGQLVYVEILARTTIEGHSFQPGDFSYWHNPELSTDYWMTKSRPAVVLDVSLIRGRHQIKVIPLGRGRTAVDLADRVVRITDKPSDNSVVIPDWPLDDTYLYAFPRAQTFLSFPQTVPVPAHWRVAKTDAQLLLTKFDQKLPAAKVYASIDPVLRDYARMKKRSIYSVYARFTPMTPETLLQDSEDVCIDWNSGRGWFDELVKIDQRRSADNGWAWTRSPIEDTGEDSDSYFDLEMDWSPQKERDRSLTLEPSEATRLDEEIDQVVEVFKRPALVDIW